MSNREDRFWELAEQLIASANQLAEDADHTEVCDALLYAAARYASYVSAESCGDRKSFKEEFENIRSMLLEQFTHMLSSNLDDYLENYKIYIEKERVE